MRRIACVLMAIACALICLTGCQNGDDTLTKVELSEVTRSVFYAPQYVAISKGFFADEGLEIHVTTAGGSDKAMTALLSKQADICLAGPETGVYVYNEGKTDYPKIVGQLTKRDGSFLVGRTEEPNFEWESLKGKTIIGGRAGGMPMMTLCYVLRQHGLEPSQDLEVIDNIQFNLMGGAFEGGTGDYVTLFEPTATEFQNAGKGYIVANVGLSSGEVPYTVYLARQETIQTNAALIEHFLKAVYRAQQWIISASDEEIAQAMQPFFPDSSLNSLKIVASSYKKTDSWKTEPAMLEEDYTRLLDVVEGSGQLSARPPFEKLIDNAIAYQVTEK
ncbi:MAG: ABC transporter substrate-binding protein [Clostridia bacterium]